MQGSQNRCVRGKHNSNALIALYRTVQENIISWPAIDAAARGITNGIDDAAAADEEDYLEAKARRKLGLEVSDHKPTLAEQHSFCGCYIW